MPTVRIPRRLKTFLRTEAGLFSIQLVLFVPVIGVGLKIVLPAL